MGLNWGMLIKLGKKLRKGEDSDSPAVWLARGLAVNYSGGASMPSDVSAWLETNHVDKK